ncbi:hypothetical protein SFC43_09660 [Bacteroides sp. CR5/BHMF/2]|nr:hypothetical protein [Bacteroides sp. CR5/BHMF/2]
MEQSIRRDWFKEVMQAKTYAEAGPEFDPNDIRFNCFRYVVSDFPNAMGNTG